MDGILLTFAILAVLVVVHEIGHLVAGLAIGIPRSAMTIRFGVPVSDVILLDNHGPIEPTDHVRFRRLVPTNRGWFLFTVGGLAAQTIALGAAATLLARFSRVDRFAERVVWASLLMLMGYVVIGVILTRRTGRPQGDSSTLWRLSPAATLVGLATAGLIHVGLLSAVG